MRKSLLLKLHLHPSPLWVIFEINFFRNLAAAMLTSIISLYFKKIVGSDAAVGAVFFVGYVAAFCSHLYSAHIIEHLKKRKTLLLALACFSLIFAVFTIIENTALLLFAFALYHFILALFVLDISLYLKHYSNYREIAENVGKLGSLSNIGWIIGPLLGSLIANKFGFEAVFYASSAISLIALLTFFLIRLKSEEIHFLHNRSFTENIKLFFKDPNLRHTYINNAGLGFIYSMWDLLPLLMFKIGATILTIGMTKTLMGIAQSIFEYPIGRLADKETGERKIFIIGYLFAALFTLLLGLTTDLKIFIMCFFLAATGTSFLEMTRDSYFFRQMPEKEIELLSVYRTSDTLPYIIGQGLAVAVLFVLPIEWWFIIGSLIALIIFVPNACALKEFKKT